MSNINRSDNSIVDNGEDSNLVRSSNDFESITIDQTHSSNCISISSQEPTFRSQLVVDERSNDFNELTNQRINDLTAYQSRSPRLSSSINVYNISIGQSHTWNRESVFNYVFAANRDQQSNARIQFPSDAVNGLLIDLLTPAVVQLIFNLMFEMIPLGTQDTQPHTLILPVHVITNPTDVGIDNENGDINEDGTGYDDIYDSRNDENMDSSTIFTQHDEQMILNESSRTETMDESSNNLNRMNSTDTHNDNCLNINDQHEQFMEDENTSETEHQDSLNYEHNERGQVSRGTEDADNNEIHDNVQSNVPPTPILTSSISSTPTTELPELVGEIEPMLAGPTDNDNPARADSSDISAAGLDVSQLNTQNRKQPNELNPNEKIDEIQR